MAELHEYQALAVRTESQIQSVSLDYESFYHTLQAYVSIGKVLDTYKKNVFYGKPVDENKVHALYEDAVFNITTATRARGRDPYPVNEHIDIDPRVFHAIIGICTESVELAEAIVKVLDGGNIDRVNIREELFDCLWYIFIGHDTMGQDMHETIQMGLEKLRLRFPDKFTSDRSINRDVASERALLESYTK